MLSQWQAEPDLAGLRESSLMGNMSADERAECVAIWQRVSELLSRARASK
jgi:hypothetical protein